mmetsp:Transcript_66868/g.164912  ORF Transcript_66868/g.164912 Transcript_66868/m.164912 type:complete len:418 (-) Transcript_66868:2757-4010(-)
MHLVKVCEGAEEVSAVLVVGHATAVVALADQVVEGFELILLVVVKHEFRLLHADRHVPRRELVRDVPAERPEGPPLLHNGVEEGQRVGQLLPLLGLLARVEKLHVAQRIRDKGALDVEPDTLGGLVGHFDAILQHRDGEDGRRVASEPQPKVLVGRLRLELLTDALELHHPAPVHVAVLQHDPVASLVRLLHIALRDRALPLPQTHNLHRVTEALLVGELEQRRVGVRARRQHKDERGAGVGVLVARREVEGRGLDEGLAHLLGDEEHDGRHELVGADAAHDHQPRVRVALVPLAGERVRVRLRRLEHVAPRVLLPPKLLLEALGPLQIAHPAHLPPVLVLQPRVVRVRVGPRHSHAAREQKLHLLVGELLLGAHEPRAEEEGEDKLVLLEERAAHHLVEEVGEVLVEVVETRFEVG